MADLCYFLFQVFPGVLCGGRLQQLVIVEPLLATVLGIHSLLQSHILHTQPLSVWPSHHTTPQAITYPSHHATTTDHPTPLGGHPTPLGTNDTREEQNPLINYTQPLRNKCRVLMPLRPPQQCPPYPPMEAQTQRAVMDNLIHLLHTATCVPMGPYSTCDSLPSITELQTVPTSLSQGDIPSVTSVTFTPSLCDNKEELGQLPSVTFTQCEEREELVLESDDELDIPAAADDDNDRGNIVDELTMCLPSPHFPPPQHEDDGEPPSKKARLDYDTLKQEDTSVRDDVFVPSLNQDGPLLGPEDKCEPLLSQDGPLLGPEDKCEPLLSQDGPLLGPEDKCEPLLSQDGPLLGPEDKCEPLLSQDGPLLGPEDKCEPLLSQDGPLLGPEDEYEPLLSQEEKLSGSELKPEVSVEGAGLLLSECADDGSFNNYQTVPSDCAQEHAPVAMLAPCNPHGGRGGGGGEGSLRLGGEITLCEVSPGQQVVPDDTSQSPLPESFYEQQETHNKNPPSLTRRCVYYPPQYLPPSTSHTTHTCCNCMIRGKETSLIDQQVYI